MTEDKAVLESKFKMQELMPAYLHKCRKDSQKCLFWEMKKTAQSKTAYFLLTRAYSD